MAQEPFGDAHAQQPWQPQNPPDWQNDVYGGYSEQHQTSHQSPQQPIQWQPQPGYGSAEYGQQPPHGQEVYGQDTYGHTGYDQGGYGRTGYVEGGYVQGQYGGGQEQYQPYPQYPDHAQQQPHTSYAASQQPLGAVRPIMCGAR
ncbi:hypothetical protein ACIQOW_39005 [Kitasatospora sp. NPDC091335]|uniref:hypothetical protein n=1 Tax=Kitasatospora sp. NPDC091335 TaxID=3364085 RepID=UPI00381598E7